MEVGPHHRGKGGQAGGRSLCVGVGHPESPWDTRRRKGNHSDEAVLLRNRGTHDHVLRMRGPREFDHLDNCGYHFSDEHLLCQGHSGGSPLCSRPKSVGHHVAYRGTGFARKDPSIGWVVAPTHHVLRRRLIGVQVLAARI